MTQQEHLTTEQLSAYLDKQLTPQEQAFFDAHLQSCQHCQHVLGDLRSTVALLHAMPQPPLPRSFTLPAGISQIPAARTQPQPAQQRRVLSYTLQRTMRAVSTLAAVIAVIFILSGLLANVHPGGGGAASTAAPVFSTSNGAARSPSARPNLTQSPQTRGSTPVGSPVVPAPTPTTKSAQGLTDGTVNPPTLPPFLDISQPAGRLALGALLLLLSIIGIIATRRRRDAAS